MDTFRHILSLPDPRESMPRSSTSVMGLDDEKGRQELRLRGPSSMLPLSSVIKDAFDKDFQTANLPEGKYIKPPSTTKWYKVGQPCCKQKIHAPGAPMGKVRLFLKNCNTQLGKTFPRSILLLPLPRLLALPAVPLLRRANIA